MVRRVAGPDAATGKSCCRSGFSRELLPWSPRLAAEAAPTRAEARKQGSGRGDRRLHAVAAVGLGGVQGAVGAFEGGVDALARPRGAGMPADAGGDEDAVPLCAARERKR